MATIKKITAKTIFFITAVVGFGFISSLLGRIFFGDAEVNFSQLESAIKKDAVIGGSIVPIAQADLASADSGGGDGAGSCSDGSGDGCSGAGCFIASQKVLTPSGEVEIGKLEKGTTVVSYDESTDKFKTSTIEKILIHDGINLPMHDYKKYALIDLAVDTNGDIVTTKVTENHLYYHLAEKKYKQIGEFIIGDKVRTINGVGTVKSKVELIGATSPEEDRNTVVYNLHMEEDPHNYLVNGVVVHNIK